MQSVALSVWLLTLLVSRQFGTTHAAIVPGLPYTCKTSLSEELRDDLFSASSYFSKDTMPHHARLGQGGWRPSSDTQNEYLKLDFERIVEITGVSLVNGGNDCGTKSVRMSYSDDGLVWKGYNNMLSSDPDPVGDILAENDNGVVEVHFDPHIKARFFAVNPKTYYNISCMTIEVVGCDVTTGSEAQQPTHITSNIDRDTIWTSSMGPIVIDRSIEVVKGAKLVVQDGVTVVFTREESGLSVHGDLETHGTDSASVLFTSNFPALITDRQWAGINGNQEDGLIDLEYTTVRQATDGITALGTGVKMGFSLVHSCDLGLKVAAGKSRQTPVSILNSKFMYSDNGILIVSSFEPVSLLTNTTFDIRNNVFKHVTDTGIALYGNNDHVYIENNTFEDGGCFIDAYLIDDEFDRLVIKGNTVRGSSADGIVNITQPPEPSSSPTVSLTGNWFVNNSGVVVSFMSPYYLQILNNFFENSNATYNLRVVETPYTSMYVGVTAEASRNYWGTDEGGTIAYTIFDHDADEKLFDVNFRPFLASKNTSDVVTYLGSFYIDQFDNHILIHGDLFGSVIIGARKDPYYVTANTYIKTTGRLIIEPGVRIEFSRNVAFLISGRGQIVAMGTQEAPIVMTYQENNGRWKGLDIPSGSASVLQHVIINRTSEGLIVRSLTTKLQHVTVVDSRINGIQIALENDPAWANTRSRPKREDAIDVLKYAGLRAINNGIYGIYLHDFYAPREKIVLDGCTLTGNLHYGANVEAQTNVEFKDCEISQNRLNGMVVDQTTGTTNVWSSTFEHNNGSALSIMKTNGFHLYSSLIRSDYRMMIHFNTYRKNELVEETELTFCNNTFEYTSLYGISIDLEFPKTIHVDICDNGFIGGTRALSVSTSPDYTGVTELKITGNSVMNISSASSSQHAIFSFDGSFPDSRLTVNNNTFKENKSPACVFITGANNDNNFIVHVENNDFAPMTEPFTAYIDIDSYPTTVFRNNRFSDTGNQCYLKAPAIFDSGYTMKATHNYWGTNHVQDVMERVCGFDSSLSRSRVDYMPFFLDEALTNLKDTHGEFTTLQAGSTYPASTGGEVAGEITLSASDEDGLYVISRSIWVRKGAVLTIEKGVTLEFESGRGIYVDGQLNVVGGEETVIFTNRTLSPWYGIVLSANADITNTIEDVIVENTQFGIAAQTDQFMFKRAKVRNADIACFTISPVAKGNFYLNDILLQNCSNIGLKIHGHHEITASNLFIENATVGISATINAGVMTLKSMSIMNAKSTAVAVLLKPGDSHLSVTVQDCAISNAEEGIVLTVDNHQTTTDININNNTFKNVREQALMIVTKRVGNVDPRNNITVFQNSFINICSVLLTSGSYDQVNFKENDVYGTLCKEKSNDAVLNVEKDKSDGIISIMSNAFRQIKKARVVNLQDSDDVLHFTGNFYNNVFLGCKATGAVILLGTEHFRLNGNLFESPDVPYDILVSRHGNGEVDAKDNWFGGKGQNEASKRVYDKLHDQNLLTVTIDPVRVTRPPGCNGIGNCNSHGTCVGTESCVCHPGWTGQSCDTFDCRGAHRCYRNGKCVGPNQCECSEGWHGEVCNMPFTDASTPDEDDDSGMRPWVAVVIVLVLCLLLVTAIVVLVVCRRSHRRRDTAYTMASSSEEPGSVSFRSNVKTSEI